MTVVCTIWLISALCSKTWYFILFCRIFSVCAYKNDVYITGGHSNSGCTVDTVSMYISKINQWNTLAPMQHPRERHGSAAADGDVYVAGKYHSSCSILFITKHTNISLFQHS